MRKRVLGVALGVMVLGAVVAGCSTKKQQKAGLQGRQLASTPVDPEREKLNAEIFQLQELVEEALVWRVKAAEFAKKLKNKQGEGPLTREDIETLYGNAVKYTVYRDKMLEIAHRYDWMAEHTTKFKLAPGKGTSIALREPSSASGGEAGVAPAPYYEAVIDPSDSAGRQALIQMKVSLGAALVLYDNYVIGIYPFQNNEKVRYLMNRDNPEAARFLSHITQSFMDPRNRRLISTRRRHSA